MATTGEGGRIAEERGPGGALAPGAAGSGIGLSIVRDILRMHGCIIKAESSLGEGSVFTFTLPVAGSQEPTNASGPSSSSPGEKAPSSRPSSN